MTPVPRVGLAVSTTGRPTLVDLIESAARSTVPPNVVAVADHTPLGDLRVHPTTLAVVVVASTGGASRGRNDALNALRGRCEVVGFPNDDCTYPPDTLERVAEAFAVPTPPVAVACTLLEPTGPRFRLPPRGAQLDRRTVWRAIEPATFFRVDAFREAGGFRDDLGAGADTPWQSGDGTDLLLNMMGAGGLVVSRPDLVVLGCGERKGLSADAFVAKHRAYARGTGFVYRIHDYPLHDRVRVAVAPLLKAPGLDACLRLSLRLALARSLGRVEGLTGRRLPGSKDPHWL